MTTLKDVAARAGVSVSVVSAFLNDSKYVRMSAQTRARVAAAIAATSYVPNHAARALRLARSGVVAVVVPKLGNPIFEEMLAGIQDAAEELGSVVLLAEAMRVKAGSNLLSSLQSQGRVDGLLLRPTATVADDVLRHVVPGNIPAVILDEWPTRSPSSISLDERRASRCAVEHLVSLGHERIGFIGAPSPRRYQGYRDGMRAAGLTVRQRWTSTPGFSPDQGGEALAAVMSSAGPPPTAVVVNNVTTALGVLARAPQLGVRIPSDLSVIAIHDIPTAAYLLPALTTVHLPMYELGHQGMLGLAAVLAGNEWPSRMIDTPDPYVIERASTTQV